MGGGGAGGVKAVLRTASAVKNNNISLASSTKFYFHSLLLQNIFYNIFLIIEYMKLSKKHEVNNSFMLT